ncbi:MAG: hypothetical protein RLZZ338_3300 [Cyanobacteriota bacterium]|jgi:hypothetical protein
MKNNNEIPLLHDLNKLIKDIPPIVILVGIFSILLVLFTSDRLVLTLIGGLIGYLVGRQVDKINREERKEEVASLIMSRLEKHWESLDSIHEKMTDFAKKAWWEISPEAKAKSLGAVLPKLEKDGVYQAAIYQIGIFPVELIDCISNYDLSLGVLADGIRHAVINPKLLEDPQSLENLATQLHATKVNGALCFITLKNKFLLTSHDLPKVDIYQEYLQEEYVPNGLIK